MTTVENSRRQLAQLIRKIEEGEEFSYYTKRILSQTIGITDPFTQAIIMRILSSMLSLLSVVLLIYVFKNEIKSDKLLEWFLYLSFFLWFAVYAQVRFSSEGWSGSLFFIGFALLYYFKSNEKVLLTFLLIGLIFGFAFIFRYQVGLLISGLLLWLLIIDKFEFKDKFNGVSYSKNKNSFVFSYDNVLLYYDVNKNKFLAEVLGFEYTSLEELLKKSDIITLHVPYNKFTHHLINKNIIKRIFL